MNFESLIQMMRSLPPDILKGLAGQANPGYPPLPSTRFDPTRTPRAQPFPLSKPLITASPPSPGRKGRTSHLPGADEFLSSSGPFSQFQRLDTPRPQYPSDLPEHRLPNAQPLPPVQRPDAFPPPPKVEHVKFGSGDLPALGALLVGLFSGQNGRQFAANFAQSYLGTKQRNAEAKTQQNYLDAQAAERRWMQMIGNGAYPGEVPPVSPSEGGLTLTPDETANELPPRPVPAGGLDPDPVSLRKEIEDLNVMFTLRPGLSAQIPPTQLVEINRKVHAYLAAIDSQLAAEIAAQKAAPPADRKSRQPKIDQLQQERKRRAFIARSIRAELGFGPDGTPKPGNRDIPYGWQP